MIYQNTLIVYAAHPVRAGRAALLDLAVDQASNKAFCSETYSSLVADAEVDALELPPEFLEATA